MTKPGLTWPRSEVFLHFACLQTGGVHLLLPQGCWHTQNVSGLIPQTTNWVKAAYCTEMPGLWNAEGLFL